MVAPMHDTSPSHPAVVGFAPVILVPEHDNSPLHVATPPMVASEQDEVSSQAASWAMFALMHDFSVLQSASSLIIASLHADARSHCALPRIVALRQELANVQITKLPSPPTSLSMHSLAAAQAVDVA
jgi:hypothetical protein